MLANRVGAGLCEMHYGRFRRNGHAEWVGGAKPGKLRHTHGYLLVAAKGHPRALGGYRAYEHRVVFFDAHGQGPFKCHWCEVPVTWQDMHVDHVDADRTNNSPSNLVSSCALCNQKRGEEAVRRTMRKKHGIEFNGVVLTALEWASRIGISASALRARLRSGWDLERALTEGRGAFGPTAKRTSC